MRREESGTSSSMRLSNIRIIFNQFENNDRFETFEKRLSILTISFQNASILHTFNKHAFVPQTNGIIVFDRANIMIKNEKIFL